MLERTWDVLRISYSNHAEFWDACPGPPTLTSWLTDWLTSLCTCCATELGLKRLTFLLDVVRRRRRRHIRLSEQQLYSLRATTWLEWMKSTGRDAIYIMDTFLCEYGWILIPLCPSQPPCGRGTILWVMLPMGNNYFVTAPFIPTGISITSHYVPINSRHGSLQVRCCSGVIIMESRQGRATGPYQAAGEVGTFSCSKTSSSQRE